MSQIPNPLLFTKPGKAAGGASGRQLSGFGSTASSLILATMDGVVHCNDCRFTTDLGCCTKSAGACVVENAGKVRVCAGAASHSPIDATHTHTGRVQVLHV